MPTWIGVDLAWKPERNPTAVAVLSGDGRAAKLTALERALASLDVEPPLRGRLLAEVYPHAAMVELFDLDERIAYKKGRVAQKRKGLARLRDLLRSLEHADLPLVSTPALEALYAEDLEALRGRALKSYEDALDALFCAYLAFRMMWLSGDGFRMFGDVESGYIVNPAEPLVTPSRS